jgi:hypothetical protein
MKELKLEELMRYVLAGAIGLVALLIGFCDVAKPMARVSGVTQASLLLLVALAFGSIVYAVHRSLLYPVLYHLGLLVLIAARVYALDVRLFWLFLPARLELSLDFLRWKRAAACHYAHPRIAEWGAQVHFLYCSGWTIFLIQWLGYRFGLQPTGSRVTLFWIASWLIAIGFLGYCRLLYFDSQLALREVPELAPQKNGW